jgi:subtilisin-like proprotein convertase family protein
MLDLASVPTTFDSADVPKPITDFATTTSVINVGSLGTILDIEVTVDITHSFMADLDAFLTSPSGRIVELFTGVGAQFNDFHDLTLADDAAESIADIGQDDLPYTGRWRPEGSLSVLLGDEAAGNWTLTIRDTTFADQGTLNSWSIDITIGEPFTETDEEGNYILTDLPPDQYIVREVMQPGWAQTHAPQMQLDPMGNPYNVDLPLGEAATGVDFGNQSSAPELPGDYNRDGYVDTGDWIIYQKTLNTSVAFPYDGADGNGDGMVTSEDLAVWQQNFGRGDDHGDSAPTATSVAVDSSTDGNLEELGDEDWFSFSAVSGRDYRFATFHDTLHDSDITLYGTDGVTELDYDDDGGSGLQSLLFWTAPASGTYYVAVGAYLNGYTGTYDFDINDVTGGGGGGGEALAGDDGGSGGKATTLMSETAVVDESPIPEPAGRTVLDFTQSKSLGFTTDAFGSTPVAAAGSGDGSSATSGEAAIVAWLDSLEDGDSELTSDGFMASNGADDADGESSDELEGIDALFELLGA